MESKLKQFMKGFSTIFVILAVTVFSPAQGLPDDPLAFDPDIPTILQDEAALRDYLAEKIAWIRAKIGPLTVFHRAPRESEFFSIEWLNDIPAASFDRSDYGSRSELLQFWERVNRELLDIEVRRFDPPASVLPESEWTQEMQDHGTALWIQTPSPPHIEPSQYLPNEFRQKFVSLWASLQLLNRLSQSIIDTPHLNLQADIIEREIREIMIDHLQKPLFDDSELDPRLLNNPNAVQIGDAQIPIVAAAILKAAEGGPFAFFKDLTALIDSISDPEIIQILLERQLIDQMNRLPTDFANYIESVADTLARRRVASRPQPENTVSHPSLVAARVQAEKDQLGFFVLNQFSNEITEPYYAAIERLKSRYQESRSMQRQSTTPFSFQCLDNVRPLRPDPSK